MKMPLDLRQYAAKKIISRIALCIVMLAAFTSVLMLWGERIFSFSDGQAGFRVLAYVVVMLIPLVVTGVPLKLIKDKTYWGHIEKVHIATTADSKSASKPTLEELYYKNEIFLTIKLPNGKVMKKSAYSGEANAGRHINEYHEGDTVFHLFGTGITVVVPDVGSVGCKCAVCGAQNEAENNCRRCGHSLVRK